MKRVFELVVLAFLVGCHVEDLQVQLALNLVILLAGLVDQVEPVVTRVSIKKIVHWNANFSLVDQMSLVTYGRDLEKVTARYLVAVSDKQLLIEHNLQFLHV